jgi:hypothetical protein
MLVGIITCHPIAKVGGYMVTFGTITAISYTGLGLLYHAESAYAGILFLILVPSTFFGGLILQLCKSWSNQFEKHFTC